MASLRTQQGLVLGMSTLAFTICFMVWMMFAVLGVPIKELLQLNDTQFGLLSGLVFALFYTFFGIPAGWLADRFGRIRVLFAAATIWSVFSAGGALATNFWQLALSRAGVGIGEATASPTAYSLISDYFPKRQRATALAIYSSGLYLGGGVSLLYALALFVPWAEMIWRWVP